MNHEIKIYVACLAACNNGYLHGAWVDATQPVEDIQEAIQAMLASSYIKDAEEWAIHDYSGFGNLRLSVSEDIEVTHEIALFIQEHGDLSAEVISYYGDLESAKNALENYYHGEHESELAFATELFDECYAHDIPENLRFYIDYELFCRDLFINDFHSIEVNGSYHIFSYF